MKVAIIPARGGSKRIPNKNIKLFGGKPMIVWSIEAAIQSKCFDRIVVSTDSLQIAEIAQRSGAEVPFMRPDDLANDHAGTSPVIAHAIRSVESSLANGGVLDAACCIYATAPFIDAASIRKGLAALESADCDFAFTVTTFASTIQRALRLTDAGRLAMFDPEKFNVRSQDLPVAYHDAAQFYWGRRDAWLEGRPVFSSNSVPVILPRHRVQDIDTIEDWKYAEMMFIAYRGRD